MAGIERRFGLAVGSIARVAFEVGLLQQVTSGAITKRRWLAIIADAVGPAAAAEWSRRPTIISIEVVNLLNFYRAGGGQIFVASNGTDELDCELESLGIRGCFDGVLNSANFGFPKPDARYFVACLHRLNAETSEIGFVDDLSENVRAARALGIESHLYRHPAALARWLARQ